MEESIIKHYEDNKVVFEMWISTHARLQPSMDILKPFISIYPHSIKGCQDCIIDMLIWIRSEIKKTKQNEPTDNKKKTRNPKTI